MLSALPRVVPLLQVASQSQALAQRLEVLEGRSRGYEEQVENLRRENAVLQRQVDSAEQRVSLLQHVRFNLHAVGTNVLSAVPLSHTHTSC